MATGLIDAPDVEGAQEPQEPGETLEQRMKRLAKERNIPLQNQAPIGAAPAEPLEQRMARIAREQKIPLKSPDDVPGNIDIGVTPARASLPSAPTTPVVPVTPVAPAAPPRPPSILDNPLTPAGPFAHDNAAIFDRYSHGATGTFGDEVPGSKILAAMRSGGAKLAQTQAQADSIIRSKQGPDLTQRLSSVAQDRSNNPLVRGGAMIGSMATGAIEHPVTTAEQLITAPVTSADVLTRYAYQRAAEKMGVLDKWTAIGGEPVTGKDAAWAAAQLGAIGLAGPMESVIEKRLSTAISARAAKGLPTAGMGAGAAVVSHAVPGAAIGAAYSPEDPAAGAFAGAIAGGLHAGLTGARVAATGPIIPPDRQVVGAPAPPEPPGKPPLKAPRLVTEDMPPASTEPDYTVEMDKPTTKAAAAPAPAPAPVPPATDVGKVEAPAPTPTEPAATPLEAQMQKVAAEHGIVPPREYAPEGTPVTEEQRIVRNVADGLEKAHPDAIATAAPEMATRVPPNAVLVPLPNHRGSAVANVKLAEAIQQIVPSAMVQVSLGRGTPTESSRELREKGKPGLTAEEHAESMAATLKLPKNRPVVLIDNIETTGATAEGARRVLGAPDAQLVTYAKAPIPPGEKAATAEEVKPAKKPKAVKVEKTGEALDITERLKEHPAETERSPSMLQRAWNTLVRRKDVSHEPFSLDDLRALAGRADDVSELTPFQSRQGSPVTVEELKEKRAELSRFLMQFGDEAPDAKPGMTEDIHRLDASIEQLEKQGKRVLGPEIVKAPPSEEAPKSTFARKLLADLDAIDADIMKRTDAAPTMRQMQERASINRQLKKFGLEPRPLPKARNLEVEKRPQIELLGAISAYRNDRAERPRDPASTTVVKDLWDAYRRAEKAGVDPSVPLMAEGRGILRQHQGQFQDKKPDTESSTPPVAPTEPADQTTGVQETPHERSGTASARQLHRPEQVGGDLPLVSQEERPGPVSGVGGERRVRRSGEERAGDGTGRVSANAERPLGEGGAAQTLEEPTGASGATPAASGGSRPRIRRGAESGVGEAAAGGVHGREHGALERGTAPAEAAERNPADDALPAKDLAHRGSNYRLTDADEIGGGSPKTKVRQNIAAIKLVAELRTAGREWATPEEQAILAKYVGWGAFPKYFERYSTEWDSPEGKALRESLSDTEFERARSSTKNAHYTSPEIVRGMWDAMRQLGFARGRALEPAMGSGNFVGFAPTDIPIGWTGVEKDELTGQLAKYLYPESEIHVAGYEQVALRNGAFDLAISNVPFGKIQLYDPNYKHLRKFSIHDYFFAKTLDKVRPGGVVAFITSRYTMDKASDAVRSYIAERANLLGAIRLPHTAFKGNAGTDVVTDILFLQVRPKGEKPSGETWRDLGKVDVPHVYGGLQEKSINEYYVRHPDMMLGRLSLERGQFSDSDLVLLPPEKGTLAEALGKAVRTLPEGAYTPAQRPVRGAQQLPVIEAPIHSQPGSYLVHNGTLMQVAVDKTLKPAEISKAQEPKVRQLLAIRDQARTLIKANADAAMTDADIERERKALEKLYKSFVKEHGPINLEKRTEGINKNGIAWRRVSYPNRDAISDDPGLATLLSLERYDEATDKATPADLITKGRIIPKAKPVTSVDTGFDAIAASLATFGRLDLPHMADLRGVSIDQLKDELRGEIYENPGSGEWEIKAKYLSGNVKDKLIVAENAAKQNPAFEPNVEALRVAAPPDVPPASISVRFGAKWIKPEEYAQFIAELLGVPTRAADIKISQDEHTGLWAVDPGSLEYSTANTSLHGTPKMKATEIIERSMNSLPLKVTSKISLPGGGEKTVPDKEQTALVAAKQRELVAKLRAWLFTDDAARGETMLRRFNNDYNNTVPPSYEGKLLTVPGIATHINGVKFEWFEHQKNAIMRYIQNGNILLAHAPGAGKTYTFVAMAMEARRFGLAKRPMIAVPNHMLAQATREAQQLYPGARILALGTDDTSSKAKTLLAARAASDQWDLIITTHMGMSRIPMSKAAQAEFLREQLNELRDVLETEQTKGALRSRGRPQRGKSRTVKQVEATIENYEGRLQAMLDSPADESLTFEELGADLLIVDEAHEFKNLNFATRVEGIQVGTNKGATQLFMKTKYLHQINPTHGVVFATGTPVTNSIAELWTMQRYVNPKGLVESGLERFDDWQSIFGTIVSRMEKNTVGNYEVKSRLAKYVNVPSMIQRFREFADVKTINELGLPRPPLIGGSFVPIVAPEPRGMKSFLSMLKEEWDDLKKMTPEEQRASGKSFLSIGNQAKMAGLDMRLVDASYTDEDGPFKVELAANELFREYTEHAAYKGVQVVFLDASVDKGEDAVSKLGGRPGFNLYAELKRLLVAKGIPAKEIGFSQDANSEAKKTELKRKMNDGELRVVIASTPQLGVGANIQKRLVAEHRIDVPWRPDQIEQSEARILRMGNDLYDKGLIPGVKIFRYVTEGSYDQYSWDTVLRKAKFVAQAMAGDASIAELDEMADESSQGAQLMAALSSNNPLELERADLSQKVAELQAEAAGHRAAQAKIHFDLTQARGDIPRLKKEQKLDEKDLAKKQDTTGDKFSITINGTEYTKRPAAAEALKAALSAIHKGASASLGTFAGFPLGASALATGARLTMGSARERSFYISDDQTPTGALATLEHQARSIASDLEHYPKWIEAKEQKIRELEQLVGREFPRTKEMQDAETRLHEVEAELLGQASTPEGKDLATDQSEDYVDGPSEPESPGEGTQLMGFADPFTAAAAMLYRTKAVQASVGVAVAKLQQLNRATRAIFSAASLTPEAGRLSRIIRAHRAQFDRDILRAHEALEQVRGALDKLDPGPLYDGPRWQWYMEAEQGLPPTSTPDLQALWKVLRQMQDDVAHEIHALGPGHLDNFIQDYMARAYVPLSGAKKAQAMNLYGGKRPMQGPRGFKKQRKHVLLDDSIQAALAIGKGPPTDNPLDMVLLKIREMRRYLMAHRIFQEGRGITGQGPKAARRKAAIIKYIKASKPVPDGWAKINDGIATVYAPRGAQGETRIRGQYIAPVDAARVINNFLSPGLRGNPIYDSYSWLGNTMNLAQLGMSAFHAGFVAFDAMAQLAVIGSDEILHGVAHANPRLIVRGAGKVGLGIASAVTGPMTVLPLPAAALQYWRGRQMWHAYMTDASTAELRTAIDGMIQGGGRAKMDEFYRAGNIDHMRAALRDHRWAAAGLRAPFAALEGMMYPLLEHLVPRMKLGAMYYAMQHEMMKLGPKPTVDQVRQASARVVDVIDARLGQMIYDNLFWHRVTKELLMAGIRSVGWNVGTVDVTLGAGTQLAGNVLRMGRGQTGGGKGGGPTEPLHWEKVQYLAVLAGLVALYGAMYTYLHTGEAPKNRKDLYFPRTGKRDPSGNEERIQPATYMKDITAVQLHGIPTTVLNKMHPLLNYVGDVLQNRNYLGDMIHDEEADFWTQRGQDLKYLVGDVLQPFSIRNMRELTKRGEGLEPKVEGFLGNQAAPRSIVRTDAENLMLRYLGHGGGAMTPDEREASNKRADLRRQLKNGEITPGDVRKMAVDGELKPRQAGEIAVSRRVDPRLLQFEKLSPEQAVKVYALGTPEEQTLWKRIYKARQQQVDRLAQRKQVHRPAPTP